MDGIVFIPDFLTTSAATELFRYLLHHAEWDERMLARKTVSYGVAYNYSQISYPKNDMPSILAEMVGEIEKQIGFAPNNCLINYYPDGKSKMGFHSDQTDILEPETGIVIVSLGETRILRFKNITDPEILCDYPLPAGSLIYMTQEVQNEWKHAIPKTDTTEGRMSLTFRKISV